MSTTPSAGGGPGNLGLALIAIDTAQHASHAADPAIGENVQLQMFSGKLSWGTGSQTARPNVAARAWDANSQAGIGGSQHRPLSRRSHSVAELARQSASRRPAGQHLIGSAVS
jgi:hypothetical protein